MGNSHTHKRSRRQIGSLHSQAPTGRYDQSVQSTGQFTRHPLTRAVSAALQPSHALPAALVALCLGLSPIGGAATFAVSNTNDAGPGSLRQAVLDANAMPGLDQIRLSIISGTISLTSGVIRITDEVHIDGPGPNALTVDGNGESGIFSVSDVIGHFGVEISGLTVTNAGADASDLYYGGAIDSKHPVDHVQKHWIIPARRSCFW